MSAAVELFALFVEFVCEMFGWALEDAAKRRKEGQWAVVVFVVALCSLFLPPVHDRGWAIVLAVLVMFLTGLFILFVALESGVNRRSAKEQS